MRDHPLGQDFGRLALSRLSLRVPLLGLPFGMVVTPSGIAP